MSTVTLELLHYMQHQNTSKCYNYKETYVVTHKYTAKKGAHYNYESNCSAVLDQSQLSGRQ